MKQYALMKALGKFFLVTICVWGEIATASAKPGIQWTDSFRDGAPDEIAPLNTPFDMPDLERPTFPDRRFNIVDYGATQGGEVDRNTQAFAQAIAACSAAGGGTVEIPAGRWLTGPITLASHVNLHIDERATVLFSQDFDDYRPAVFSRHEGIECMKFHPFIYVNNAENVAITGNGVFDGQGDVWWVMAGQRQGGHNLLKMAAEGVPVEQRVFDGTAGLGTLRPNFVQPINCKNLLIEGPEFRFGGFWTINPVYCENVIVRRVKVKTWEEGRDTPNGDGVNPDSCRNVLIEYCDLDTGDDSIAIKSGKDKDGLRINKPTENVVVRYVRGYRGHGGIVCGSETSGWIRNLYGHHCLFGGTDRGLRFKTGRGRGGGIENGWFHDIAMGDVERNAITLNSLYTSRRLPERDVDESTPVIRNMHFKNIECRNARREMIVVRGIPEQPIENVTFENVEMTGALPIQIHDAKEVTITNGKIQRNKAPMFDLLASWNVILDHVTVPAGLAPVIRVKDAKSTGITVRDGNIGSVENAVELAQGASTEAVTIE